MEKSVINTHRFEFTPEFTELLEDFIRIHRLDKIDTFKESWGEWLEDNKESVRCEIRYLENIGYDGDFYDKAYKSVRYYRKNKNNEPKKEQKRKTYISLEKKTLKMMDNQIKNYLRDSDNKPSDGFNLFMESVSRDQLKTEIKRLTEYGYPHVKDILCKLKKTYKNRYFIQTQKK